MTAKRYDRNLLEKFIAGENRILQECADLLKRRIPLCDWPDEVRIAFLLALRTEEGREAYKAFCMARHLRINREFPGHSVPENPTSAQRRCSERIRSDLAGLVRLGSGRYLQRKDT